MAKRVTPAANLHAAITAEAEKPTVWNDLLEPLALCQQANVQAIGFSKSLVQILKTNPELNAKYNGTVGGLVSVINDTTAACQEAMTAIGSRGTAEVTANEYPSFLNYSATLNTKLEKLQVQVDACLPIVQG